MFKIISKNCLFVLVLFLTGTLFAQDDPLGTEVVNIVKPYSPSVSDAFKIKETPLLNDSISNPKKEVAYTIFSVPVASTFTPAKGKATNVEKAKRAKLYDNYATLGFGNYTSVLGELYSTFEISRTDNAGFFFRHNSSQGDIDGVRLDNKYYDTRLDAHYTSRQRDLSYRFEAGAEHQVFNWYGLPELILLAEPNIEIDPQQNYFSGHVGGSLSLEDSFFEKAALNIRYLGDAFSSSEVNAVFTPEFSFPMETVSIEVEGEIDYLNGSFDRNYFTDAGIKYSYLNAGVAPSVVYVDEDFSFMLGAAAFVSMDPENSESDFSIYPRVNASYRVADETVILYAGADGGIEQNSYYDFKEENPFVSPTLFIAPTKNIYEGFAGIKGKLAGTVGYNLRAAYGKDENKAVFQANPIKGFSPAYEGYEYGNSFNVVYDDINTLSVFAELKAEFSNTFSLGVNAEYFGYETDMQPEAWNLPTVKASVFSNFNITEKLYGGASLFYVGERKDLNFNLNEPGFPTPEVTLDGYADANVHLGYRFTERLSVFVNGSNLFADSYEKWLNFPVQSIQVLAGVTYKFDW